MLTSQKQIKKYLKKNKLKNNKIVIFSYLCFLNLNLKQFKFIVYYNPIYNTVMGF